MNTDNGRSLDAAVRRLEALLDARATDEARRWWEGYLRGTARFRGVRMGDIRVAVQRWYADERFAERLTADRQRDLALHLFEWPHTEDKLAGIIVLQEILLPGGVLDCRADLPRFASLFDRGWIADWNICDWFCVKVLAPLVERHGEPCARAVARWSEADSLWRRRASVVAFANLSRRGDLNFRGFSELVLEACQRLLADRERFAQTGVGWVLRELSRAEPERVAAFIEANVQSFSREALTNAVKHLPRPLVDRLRQRHRGAHRGTGHRPFA